MLGSRNRLKERISCEIFTKQKENNHLLLQARGVHCKVQNMETTEDELLDEGAELHSELKYCVKHKDLERGKKVHAHVLKRGILGKDTCIGSMLVSMYARCGDLVRANDVFSYLPVQDVVTWTTLIAGYTEHGYGEKALSCFQQMQCAGFSPDAVTYVCILKACASIGAVSKGDDIYAMILNEGLLEKNVLVGTALVDMYGKCGEISKARNVFDSLILRNVISWNTLIAGYVKHGHGDEALACFKQMVHEDLFPDEVTFLSILKACGSIGAATKGKEIHVEVITEGLLERTMMVGTALIDMYAKCGVLLGAQVVFDELPMQSGVAWNVIIEGYAQNGFGDEALKHFERMQSQGISPSIASFISTLKVCGSMGVLDKGKRIHVSIAELNNLERAISVGNALVDMYLKCGAFNEGESVFNRLPARDAILWNTLMAGYVQHGHGEKALNCLQQMQCDGILPDAFTFICLLKSCCSLESVEQNKKVYIDISGEGLQEKDILFGTMYAESDVLRQAQGVFDKLSVRDVISWNAMIGYHAHHGHGEEALNWLERMQNEGMSPNAITFIWVLKSCGSIGAVDRGKQIHAQITKKGLAENDDLVGSALVDMYAKCIALAESQKVFEELLVQDVVSWTILMDGYAQHGHGKKALDCFTQLQNEGLSPDAFTYRCILKACGGIGATRKGLELHAKISRLRLLEEDIFIGAAMVDMYVKCGELGKAQEVFEELPVRDLVSWNALVTGYAEHGHSMEALYVFERMRHEGLCPDAVTFVYILKACGNAGTVIKGKEIHVEMVREGFLENDCSVGNALVDMYAKCGELGKAKEIFLELPERDAVSWTVLITGYAQHGYDEEALNCFEGMKRQGLSPNEVVLVSVLKACGSMGALDKGNEICGSVLQEGILESSLLVSTALVDMHAKCGALEQAREIFDRVCVQNVAMWNAIVGGYAQHGHAGEAIQCFERLQCEGFSPNAVTYVCALKACGTLGTLVKGEEIHTGILQMKSLGKDTLISNAVLDMYIKCGAHERAKEVFDELEARNVASWTSLMSGYAHVGNHEAVIELFKRMIEEGGIKPNLVTFTVVLNACTHLGLLEYGQMYYEWMCTIYGFVPTLEHQTCIVDLFARAGDFEKAVAIMMKAPVADHLPIWTALLAACRKCGNLKLGSIAFQHAVQLDETDPGLYVCMRNIYASAAMQTQAHDASFAGLEMKEANDAAFRSIM